jgi:hypothetical protein
MHSARPFRLTPGQHGEQMANTVECSRMARRPDKREAEMLSEDNLKEIRHNLAHLSLPAIREFYEQAYRDCRLVYDQFHPSPDADTRAGVEATVEVEVNLSCEATARFSTESS